MLSIFGLHQGILTIRKRLFAAYPCGFPGCMKTFAVRSNATRHLRTHKALSNPIPKTSAGYAVNFDEPVVLDPVVGSTPKPKKPLKWVPQSLSTRSNVDELQSASDPLSSESGELGEGTSNQSSQRLLPVIPFANPQGVYEERNSYSPAGSHPYASSQAGSVLVTELSCI